MSRSRASAGTEASSSRRGRSFPRALHVSTRPVVWPDPVESGLSVRQRQIILRPHLDQPRHGPVELEGLAAGLGLIELVRLRLGGGEELDAGIVERIDEGDEALGLVAPLEGQSRDILDDHRVEPLGDRQVVGRAERLRAKIARNGTARRRPPPPESRPGGPSRSASSARRASRPERLRNARLECLVGSVHPPGVWKTGAARELLEAEIRARIQSARPPCAPAAGR